MKIKLSVAIFILSLFLGLILEAKGQKQSFFQFLHDLVLKANAETQKDRERLLSLQVQAMADLDPKDREWLSVLAKQYALKSFNLNKSADWKELLARVDIIPASLALAQGAKESGFGTSRFAILGNNFFGQRCFSPQCGIVPKMRDKGATYQVKRFSSPYLAVRAYVNNLNSHPAYAKVRLIRSNMRQTGKPLQGEALAFGLIRYSTRGDSYVKELQDFIRSNNLHRYASLPKSA